MYSIDRRRVAGHVYSLLNSLRKTAVLLQVSHSTVSRWLNAPQRKKYRRDAIKQSVLVVECIRAAVAADPFINCVRLKAVVKASTCVDISRSLVHTVLRKLGMTRKKARMCGAPRNLETKVDDFIQRRDAYLADGRTIVSLDETSFGRHVKSPYGYSSRGVKLFVRKKIPRVSTTSVIACASSDGWMSTQSFEQAIDKSIFLSYLNDLFLPEGTVIMLDNVSFHHSKQVVDYCHDRGWSLLYTPPYSPWFNPIELCFSIIKRRYAKGDCTIDDALDALTQDHCRAFFEKSLHCNHPF